jgi:quercetin dioxygenase-like cupin family protein
MTTQTMAADKPATLRTSDGAKTATSGRRAPARGPRAGPPRRRTRSWPSATQEPRPRGPLLGPAVSLRVARLGDHMGRMETLSLEALAREQMKAATAAPAGRSARTVYGGHEHVLRQTLMALTAGASMSEHENPGEATVQVLHGRVRLVADAVAWEGRDGDLLIVPQAPHTLHALEDAAVLLTVAKLP